MDVKERLDQAGVALAAVGSGSPRSAREFVETFHFTGEMYVNRDLSVYNAFGLERGVAKTLGFSSLVRGIATMSKGFRQGRAEGDLWQQGGLFLLGPGDRMLFAHKDRFAGDHGDINACLAIVEKEG